MEDNAWYESRPDPFVDLTPLFDYSNVHKDVTVLSAWLVIEKDEAGKVFVPWDEIDVRWPLLKAA